MKNQEINKLKIIMKEMINAFDEYSKRMAKVYDELNKLKEVK